MTAPAYTESTNWREANQRYLMQAIALVRKVLERQAGRDTSTQGENLNLDFPHPSLPPPALEQLCTVFGLSSFERDVLLLCAGMELDASFPALCAAAQGDSKRTYPTFILSLAT